MAEMSNERCAELLEAVIRRITSDHNTDGAIRELLLIGFTMEELVESYEFDKSDVRNVAQEMGYGVEPTFGDLYELIDFHTANNLKHLKGSDWEIEIRNDDGREFLILYKRHSKEGEFYKQLEIHFEAEEKVTLHPSGVFNKPEGEDVTVTDDREINDGLLFSGLFVDPELGDSCREFLLQFINAMK